MIAAAYSARLTSTGVLCAGSEFVASYGYFKCMISLMHNAAKIYVY